MLRVQGKPRKKEEVGNVNMLCFIAQDFKKISEGG